MSRSRAANARRTDADELRIRAAGASSGQPAGALAASSWLHQLSLPSTSITRWHAEIALADLDEPAPDDFDEKRASRFHLDIYSEEWGVFFCHGGRASWIRVTDIAFVHGRDDHRLLAITPALRDIGSLLRRLEQLHRVKFRRDHASVRTNLPSAEAAIRSWVASL